MINEHEGCSSCTDHPRCASQQCCFCSLSSAGQLRSDSCFASRSHILQQHRPSRRPVSSPNAQATTFQPSCTHQNHLPSQSSSHSIQHVSTATRKFLLAHARNSPLNAFSPLLPTPTMHYALHGNASTLTPTKYGIPRIKPMQ